MATPPAAVQGKPQCFEPGFARGLPADWTSVDPLPPAIGNLAAGVLIVAPSAQTSDQTPRELFPNTEDHGREPVGEGVPYRP